MGLDTHDLPQVRCCETQFFLQIVLIVALVLFAGVMSGLTLGLMSFNLVELEVIAKSGTPKDRYRASKILPLVKRQHLLLCTLLLSNCAALEALPIFLDRLLPEFGAILVSVTLILLFGEILPHCICSRYCLVIAATAAPLIQLLIWIFFPVAYPISKLLDLMLGEKHKELYRRCQLKTLVDLHSAEAGKGGELLQHETKIIAGALELSDKTARDAMTPLFETYAIDINSKLDRILIKSIMEHGHSRVPVYYKKPKNIIGVILVKNLLTINPAHEVPVKNVTIRRLPTVSEAMPLYEILNEFQKGLSHMAAVVKEPKSIRKKPTSKLLADVNLEMYSERWAQKGSFNRTGSVVEGSSSVGSRVNSRTRRWSDRFHLEVLQIDEHTLSSFSVDGEVIGIITMEDVIEELLKMRNFITSNAFRSRIFGPIDLESLMQEGTYDGTDSQSYSLSDLLLIKDF